MLRRSLRKITVFIGIFLALAVPSFADQCATVGDWSSGTTFTSGSSMTVTTGNLLVAGVMILSATSQSISSYSDGANTYTNANHTGATSDPNNGTWYDWQIVYAKNITGGTRTLTVTVSSSSILTGRLSWCELTGLDTTAPLDVNNVGALSVHPGTGTDAIVSPTVAANGADKVFGFSGPTQASGGQASGTGWTSANTNATGLGVGEYKTLSGAGNVTATWTDASGGGVRDYISGIAAFKPAGGGGSSTALRLTVLGVGR